MKDKICKSRIDINNLYIEDMESAVSRNLNNLKENKPLDIPLAIISEVLNKRYFICLKCGIPIKYTNLSGYCGGCYHLTEDYKKKRKEYQDTEKYKLHSKEYYKEYQKREYVKIRRKIWMKKYKKSSIVSHNYYLNNKDRIKSYLKKYYQENKEIMKSKFKKYYQKNKKKLKEKRLKDNNI